MNRDSMGQSFGRHKIVLCDFCGGNHVPYYCPSNRDSCYYTRNNNWDTSHFNDYTQSCEDHPNFFLNGQDNGMFTSPTPSYQDWSNTCSNTFNQSWEEQLNFSGSFQGDDFSNSFLPPAPSLELVENFKSLENMMNEFIQSTQKSIANITTYVEEINRQSQIPILSEIENFECIGNDEVEVNTLENSQEIENSEEAPEHLSNPSSLQNSEEEQQNAMIVINPCFEFVQKEHSDADDAPFLQESCEKNFKLFVKRDVMINPRTPKAS